MSYTMLNNDAIRKYDKSYTQITYQEFYDYVIAKCIEHPQLNKDGRYLLEQYANNLREPVRGAPMALVNTPLCHEIYDRYPEVLNEIFDELAPAEKRKNVEAVKKVRILYK